MDERQHLVVDLGPDRSYPIVFAPLSFVGASLTQAMGGNAHKCVLVSNDVVGPLYRAKVESSLNEAGWTVAHCEIKDGEAEKTPETALKLVMDVLDTQPDRHTPIVALGGGVTTDIAGFAASTVLRGLPFINIPTSLLAMVDASVGGKTGVNTRHGKNLWGAFWQPRCVHIAVEALATLDDAELRCGLGEVVKHAVLGPDNDDFFSWLETNASRIVAREDDALVRAVRECCAAKAAIVSADERESGKRALLNLGHTVGHAIERVVGYGGLRHGEAVAIGTIAETHLAVVRGVADASLVKRIEALVKAVGLPTRAAGLSGDELAAAVFSDKKMEGKSIKVTIPHAIGDVRLEMIFPEELRPAFLYLDAKEEA